MLASEPGGFSTAGGSVEATVAPPVGNTFQDVGSVAIKERWDTSAQIEIRTTEAEMRNILHSHLESLTAREAWVPPLTVILPIGLALLAGIKSANVETVLLVCLGASLFWFGGRAKAAYRCRGHEGIDSIINELRSPISRPAAPTSAHGYLGSLWRALLRRPAN